jgi:hypothetical protein
VAQVPLRRIHEADVSDDYGIGRYAQPSSQSSGTQCRNLRANSVVAQEHTLRLHVVLTVESPRVLTRRNPIVSIIRREQIGRCSDGIFQVQGSGHLKDAKVFSQHCSRNQRRLDEVVVHKISVKSHIA